MLAPHFNRGPVFNWPSWSGVMRDEYAKQSAPKPPRCVGWARPMRLARRTSRFGRLPVLYTFQCREYPGLILDLQRKSASFILSLPQVLYDTLPLNR